MITVPQVIINDTPVGGFGQLVEPTDRSVVDDYLWNGAVACALDHFRGGFRLLVDGDFGVFNAAQGQEPFGSKTELAVRLGIEGNHEWLLAGIVSTNLIYN